MDFGKAIKALKKGRKVTRKGWNGKGMYLWLKAPVTIKEEWCQDPILLGIARQNGGSVEGLGTICMKTADNKVLTGWNPSQTDVLSEDWGILNFGPGIKWDEGETENGPINLDADADWDSIPDYEKATYQDIENLSDKCDNSNDSLFDYVNRRVQEAIADKAHFAEKIKKLREELNTSSLPSDIREMLESLLNVQ